MPLAICTPETGEGAGAVGQQRHVDRILRGDRQGRRAREGCGQGRKAEVFFMVVPPSMEPLPGSSGLQFAAACAKARPAPINRGKARF